MFRDPRDLFDAAHAAMAREDWRGLARMCDPASLRLFKIQTLRSLEPRSAPKVTVEEYLKHEPDMPRNVAEYHVSRIGQGTGPEVRLREEFPTLSSVSELTDLDPVDLFALWLEGKSPRAQLEQALQVQQFPEHVAEQLRQDMRSKAPAPPPILVGVVYDGDRVAHLLQRDDHEGAADASITDEDVQVFQRDVASRRFVRVETIRKTENSGWCLIADWGMLGLGHYAMFFEPFDDDAAAV